MCIPFRIARKIMQSKNTSPLTPCMDDADTYLGRLCSNLGKLKTLAFEPSRVWPGERQIRRQDHSRLSEISRTNDTIPTECRDGSKRERDDKVAYSGNSDSRVTGDPSCNKPCDTPVLAQLSFRYSRTRTDSGLARPVNSVVPDTVPSVTSKSRSYPNVRP